MSTVREPTIWLSLIKGIIALLVAFGVGITTQQTDAIVNVASILITLAGAGAFAWLTHRQRELVTPVAAPRLPAGTTVEVIPLDPAQDSVTATLPTDGVGIQ